jgi:hypothetical protein
VIAKRITARTASYQLLRRLVEENGAAGSTRLQDQERSGWWNWLECFEYEIRKEKQLLDPKRPDYVQVPEQREYQLLSIDAELATKQERSMEALKLIIKFRFDEHSRTKSDSDEAFRLLTNASFPPKLLSLVFEAAVKAQVPRLLVNQSTTLATVAKAICSQWPKDLGSDVRSLLLKTTTRAILEHSLIKISATFTPQHELIVPPTLQGSEDLLGYLVLEVQSMPRENASIGRLNQGTESIGNVGLHFPNLEVCVVLLHIIHEGQTPLIHSAGMDSIERTRSYRVIKRTKGAYQVTTVEYGIVEFIDAFFERGPGKRKFVRFSHEYLNQRPFYVGPLVRVRYREPSNDAPSTGETTPMVNAKHIFDTAYQNWVPRN